MQRPIKQISLFVIVACLVGAAALFTLSRERSEEAASTDHSSDSRTFGRDSTIEREGAAGGKLRVEAPRLPVMVRIEDRGSRKDFEIALDEAVFRNQDGEDMTVAIDPPATLESLQLRISNLPHRESLRPVCYEKGRPHTVAYRRIITPDITLQLPDDGEIPPLPQGVTLKEIPEYAPGFAVVSATDPFAALAVVNQLRDLPKVTSAEVQLASQRVLRAMPNDPLVGNQWHLKFQGQSGAVSGTDVNVEDAWLYGASGGVKGAGIRIGIVDDGLQTAHPDLVTNVDTVNDKDWNGNDNNPDPGSGDDHGTACAGNAAARGNNGVGVTGTAPEATLVGMRLIAAAASDSQEAEAMSYLPQLIQLKSNSWGPSDNGSTLEAPGSLTRASIKNAADTGRNGLGSIFVWAGGNGLEDEDNSNYDGYANDIHTIAVAATDSQGGQSYYSEPGANIVISAPSSGDVLEITTTDLVGSSGYNASSSAGGGDYTDSFGGTSSATPTVAGIIALMLEKNPNLGWRDVQEILIQSAKEFDPGDSDWITNAAGFHFNHKYGAGLIDATAAVGLAGSWSNLGTSSEVQKSMSGGSVAIPDFSSGNATAVERTFVFSETNLRVEHVTVTVDIAHTYRGDLEIVLVSPSGTESRLAEEHSDNGNNFTNWTFSTVRCWGEDSDGTWTLRVTDRATNDTGTLQSALVTLHGAAVAPTNPAPTVEISSPADQTVFSPGSIVNVSVDASDLNADGSPGTVTSVQLFDNEGLIATDTVAPFEFSFSPGLGDHSLAALAVDGEGESTTSIAVSILVEDQAPVITSADLNASNQAYSDEAISVAGLLANDPEGQTLTFEYLWEKSDDAFVWTSSGVTSSSLTVASGNSGYLWRCRIVANDGNRSSLPFYTETVNILERPPTEAAIGSAFSYQSGLVLRENGSPFQRSALINEFSQGSTSNSEWLEVLVLGETSFRGWKVANGEGDQLLFKSVAQWDSIPVGTLIVIYDGTSKDSLLPEDDNGREDGVLVLSSSDSSLFSGSWPGFENSGDSVRLMDSADLEVAGFSYGSSVQVSPELGEINSNSAAFYSGSDDEGADDEEEWIITTSLVSRRSVSTRDAGDMIISEYVEGSGNNKVLELYNPGPASINLGSLAYSIEVYANGATTPNSTVSLFGAVPAGEVYVVKNTAASSSIDADKTSGGINFNGNDAIVLKKGSLIVDSFGQVGFNPGQAWNSGGVSTVNQTLRRKASIHIGDSAANDIFNPSLEWIQYPVDTFSGLGSHMIDPLVLAISVDVSPSTITEDAGPMAAVGSVTLETATEENLTIDLGSSDTNILTVPASVVVLAGETQATFAVSAVDDSEPDGPQVATITASATGFEDGEFEVSVTDDEPSIIGVTPGAGNTVANSELVSDLLTGVLNTPANFRFGSASNVPVGLEIDPNTGLVSGTPDDDAGDYLIVIERFNVLDEVVSQSFTLALGGLGFADWISGYPGISDSTEGGDPDNDGMSNFLEYYLGSVPNIPDAEVSLPVLTRDGTNVSLNWRHLKEATNASAVVEWSVGLVSWQDSEINVEVTHEDATHESLSATLPIDPEDLRKFLRLRIE